MRERKVSTPKSRLGNRRANTSTATKTVSVQATPTSAPKRGYQSSIKQWYRSKSEPSGSSTDGAVIASGHPSSDDFRDDDMADVLIEMSKRDPLSGSVPGEPQQDGEIMPTDDELFETPPSTPPDSKRNVIGLGIGLEGQTNDSGRRSSSKPENGIVNNKKRPYSDSEPMKPPPSRRVSRDRPSGRRESNCAGPTPPPDSYNFKPHSFDSISVSSSMTSASPAWTSPNTSFCADSLATSFDSTADETDITVRPFLGPKRQSYSPGQLIQWPVGSSANDRNIESKPPLKSIPPNPTALLKTSGTTEAKSATFGPPDVDMTKGAMAYTETQGLTKPSPLANLEKRLFLKTPAGMSFSQNSILGADILKLPKSTTLQVFPSGSFTK